MNRVERLFIVGQPGAGKTLLAKTLANKLGWEFIDADFGLEFKIGLDIKAILGEEGSTSFQTCQTSVLNQLIKEKNIIVTTDASIVGNKKNQQILSSELTVFLDVSVPVQLERNSRNPRALIQNDVEVFLEKMHKERDDLFQKVSTLQINSDDSALDRHVDHIIQFLVENKCLEMNAPFVQSGNKERILFHRTLHTPIKLTSQQALCVKLLADGKSAKEIARDMGISFRTVEAHITKAMELTGCANSKELIASYLS